MNILEVIELKRDGKALTKEHIDFFVNSYTSGSIPDYQASAFLMAIYLNGLDNKETGFLTEAMLNSGTVLDFSSIKGVKVDKHSTGGVGDKPSLIIAPICAALGVHVPMIAGRGLGHTGGTLDKLESIPGFSVDQSLVDFEKIIREVGFSIIGQTKEIAPADKLLYALRDVTATVSSIPLISASIMSKKMAEGIDALILDVKTGAGAFMKSSDDAELLAKTMIDIGVGMGKSVKALITDMSQPLGAYVGNSLEVIESVEILKNIKTPESSDLRELCLSLSAHMVCLSRKAINFDEAHKLAEDVLENGKALEKFKMFVTAQGGDEKVCDDYSLLLNCPFVETYKAKTSGYITGIDALLIGKAGIEIGVGRQRKEDSVDPGAGFKILKKVGDKVESGDALMEVHHSSKENFSKALEFMERAYKFADKKPDSTPIVIKTL